MSRIKEIIQNSSKNTSPIIPQIVVKAEENPDWFYPRTKRFLLRVPTAEFGLSCASVKTIINNIEYITPNRDYSYEGFTALLNLENWKISDGFAFSIFDENKNRFIAPNPVELIIKPNEVIYTYEFGKNKIFTTYQLIDLDNAALLKVHLNITEKSRIRLAPFIDIRHVYNDSAPKEHIIKRNLGSILNVGRQNYELQISIDKNNILFTEENIVLQWIYKLGDGAREETEKGIIFKPHIKTLYIPGFFETENNNITINMTAYITNNLTINNNMQSLGDRELESVLNKFSDISLGIKYFDNALFGLISTLYMLGIRIKPYRLILPEAGAWWFRTIWIRDLMEVLGNNFITLTRLRGKLWITEVLKILSLILDKKIGLLPTNILYKNTNPCSYTVDGTLKWIINYITFISEHWDPKIGRALLDQINNLLALWNRENNVIQIDESTGLLKIVPCQSWIDTIVHVNLDNSIVHVPGRLSIDSLKELKQKGVNVEKYLFLPTTLLPEINAMWLKMLDQTKWLIQKLQLAGYDRLENYFDKINDLLKLGTRNYIKLLWNNETKRLNNAVILEYNIKDTTPTSNIAVAASIIPWIFSDNMLNQTWSTIENNLLIYRYLSLTGEKKPFGIIARATGSRIFKGDYEYHGYVVWPRDVPYLINLAYKLNKKEFIVDILLNHLDASISESTIFHARELYALPEGTNPYPSNTCQKSFAIMEHIYRSIYQI